MHSSIMAAMLRHGVTIYLSITTTTHLYQHNRGRVRQRKNAADQAFVNAHAAVVCDAVLKAVVQNVLCGACVGDRASLRALVY